MLLTLAASLALLQGGDYRTDTTVTVRDGTRLAIQAMGGDVVVRTWERSQVRIRADHSSSTRVEVHHDGAVLQVEARGRMGMPGRTDFELTVPTWMRAELDGMNFSLDVEGVAGIKASTLNGNLHARGVQDVEFNTMSGDVRVERARGRLSLGTVAGQIEVSDATGTIEASAVSGDVGLYRIESARVEAGTISGQIIYQGSVRGDGSYRLSSHSGTVTFSVPEGADATVTTSSMSGGMNASFTLPALEQRSRGRTIIRFGNGRAQVELESFSGDIRLVRPGEAPPMPPRRERGDRDRSWQGHGDAFDDLDEVLADVFSDEDLVDLGDLSGIIAHSLHAGLGELGRLHLTLSPLTGAMRPVPPRIRWER